MKGLRANNAQTYQNIMEFLVNKEVTKQIKQLPPNLAGYIDPVEVATYALNRLPALYASSEKGKQQQKIKGETQLNEQITVSVRQAIAAVQRDPIRTSSPLTPEDNPQYKIALTALKDLEELLEEKNLLDGQKISWDNLVKVVRRSLNKVAQSAMVNDQPPEGFAKEFFDWNDQKYRQ